MLFLNKPIYYLQRSDFNDNGDLVNPVIPKDKPVIIMLQAAFCGYCTQSKPAFQEFANKNAGKVFVATIQADGTEKGEKELSPLLQKIDPDFKGFPSYVKHFKGKKIPHSGGRDVASLTTFAL